MMVFSQNTLFEQIHKASPDQRLIVHSAVAPSSATRGEINRAAKRLAHTLKHDYGIGEGSVVALQMPSWQE